MSDPTSDSKAMHPRRAHIHETRTLGERAADGLAAFAGSWRFIIGQTVFIAIWITLNSVAFIAHWDPYPWILLNLCMSTQAMYTGPIVMLSQNRAAARDRLRDDTEAREVDELATMNRTQLDILNAQNAILAELRAQSSASVHDPKTGRFVSRKTQPLKAS